MLVEVLGLAWVVVRYPDLMELVHPRAGFVLVVGYLDEGVVLWWVSLALLLQWSLGQGEGVVEAVVWLPRLVSDLEDNRESFDLCLLRR